MKFAVLILIYASSVFAINSDTIAKLHKEIFALKTAEEIKIDGKLTEDTWQRSPSAHAFIQRNPNEGEEPTQKTELHLAFDDNNLYLAARMYDTSPDSIFAFLTRRDNALLSDRILIFFDPYHDKRSGYYFTINAAGTITDGVLYNDDWDDNSWDAVWEGKANIDDKGWTAEVKIPFSQLRFRDGDQQTWGFNLKRVIGRRNEEDYLTRLPRGEGGFVSRFIELKGLDGIKPSGKIEIVPYLTGKAEYLQHSEGDPFNNGHRYSPGIGADLKMGIGSNLTLNATINPDFGQVEIDPAVINLSDVETFYSEKRPFFVQGSSIFDFGVGGARNYWGFNWPGIDFFYSRRIGRVPQGSAPDTADYIDNIPGVHILGAAKVTGKMGSNWNIGTIHAFTNREFSKYQEKGNQSQAEIEPFTYYGVARVQKEFNESSQGLGMISTFTGRNFRDQGLAGILSKNAFSGGIDGWVSLDSSKTWLISGYSGLSHVTGTPERMIGLQKNSQHYFQRPDAGHVKVDSSLTSMTGFAGRYFLVKQKGNTFVNASIGFITPSFEVNDIGFSSRSDVINMHGGGGYSWNDPTSYYYYAELGGALWQAFDFDKNLIGRGLYIFGYYQLPGYEWLNFNLSYNPETINNRRTRGGPLTLNPPSKSIDLTAGTDNRNKFIVSGGYYFSESDIQRNIFYHITFDYRPLPNISFSINPSIGLDNFDMYVTTVDDSFAANTFGKRYVFGEIEQLTISSALRLNWTFTPQLSLELYMQPLFSTGKYRNLKELARPKANDFHVFENINYNADNDEFTITPDGNNPNNSFTIDNPTFDFISLRGNAVLRWEYFPGSVFYFVWTQTRSDEDNTGEFRLNKSVNTLFDSHPDNIFAIKFTYWFNM